MIARGPTPAPTSLDVDQALAQAIAHHGEARLEAASRPFFVAAAQLLLAAPSLEPYNSYTLSNLAWSFGRVRSLSEALAAPLAGTPVARPP